MKRKCGGKRKLLPVDPTEIARLGDVKISRHTAIFNGVQSLDRKLCCATGLIVFILRDLEHGMACGLGGRVRKEPIPLART